MIVVPEAFPVDPELLPWVDDWTGLKGVSLKLLMANIESGQFTVMLKCKPGAVLDVPHKHTGEVHAYTVSGEWYYQDYPDLPHCKAGSYLFEPPGSTHTLKVADHNTEDTVMLFVVYGAMIHTTLEGEVLANGDAESHLRDYPAALKAQGKALTTPIPVGGAMGYHRID